MNANVKYKSLPAGKRTIFIRCCDIDWVRNRNVSKILHKIFGCFNLGGSTVFAWKDFTVTKKIIEFPDLHFILDRGRLYVFIMKKNDIYTLNCHLHQVNQFGQVCLPSRWVNIDLAIDEFFSSQWTDFSFSTRFLIPYKKVYKPRLRKIFQEYADEVKPYLVSQFQEPFHEHCGYFE